MSVASVPVVATFNGSSLSLQDVLTSARRKGRLAPLVMEAVREHLIGEAIRKQGITIQDDELQQAADEFRRGRGLEKGADLAQWLADNGLTVEDLETNLETALQTERLRQSVTEPRLPRYFAEHRTRFDRARIAHLVVAGEGVARELLSQIQEDELDFATAARKYSLDETTRQAGGDLGLVARTSLDPVLAAVVFTAQPNRVIGPVKTARGYHLVRIDELHLGRLDEATTATIREAVFTEWLDEQVRAAKVSIRLREGV